MPGSCAVWGTYEGDRHVTRQVSQGRGHEQACILWAAENQPRVEVGTESFREEQMAAAFGTAHD